MARKKVIAESDHINPIPVDADCWMYAERVGLCIVHHDNDKNAQMITIPWRLVERAVGEKPKP